MTAMEVTVDPNEPWMREGVCNGVDPNIWFPPENMSDDVAYAFPKSVCAVCPVREPCLEYALANQIRQGMWGGATPRERRRIRKMRRRAQS